VYENLSASLNVFETHMYVNVCKRILICRHKTLSSFDLEEIFLIEHVT